MNDDLSIDGLHLEGRHVVIREGVMKPAYRDITWRVVLAKGGFGCSPDTMGSAVFAECLRDGEGERWERGQVERLATPEEVAAAEAARQS